MASKSLHLMAIPLRSIATGELHVGRNNNEDYNHW